MNLLKLNVIGGNIATPFGAGCPSCDSNDSQGGVTGNIDDEVASEENARQDADVKTL